MNVLEFCEIVEFCDNDLRENRELLLVIKTFLEQTISTLTGKRTEMIKVFLAL